MTASTESSLTLQVISAVVLLWFIFQAKNLLLKKNEGPSYRSVALLVLGDIGRSPRMMYHAESFAKNQFETFVVGYSGSKEVPSLRSLPRVRFVYLPEPPKALSKLPFLLLAPLKIGSQIISILDALLIRIPNPPQFIVVQNPPSIPTLALVWIVSKIRGSKVIIDWHNLGYSILALKLGKSHVLVKIAKIFEQIFGRHAYAHLFVTQAMQNYLVKEWNLQGYKAVLHDRPPQHFHRASPPEIHELFLRLGPTLPQSLKSFAPPYATPYSTPFTHIETDDKNSKSPTRLSKHHPFPNPANSPSSSYSPLRSPTLRPDRPALLVSSTSWTADEDFSVLLTAMTIYEQRAHTLNGKETTLPKVVVLLTGKGPLRDSFMQQVKELQEGEDGWQWVRCFSIWLEAEDYPMLLGSADLGVCLHASSSGLDLPMKVVDMFGCGLPVCALNFSCLPELVKDGKNGLIFDDATQLASQLETLLTSFPNSSSLDSLRTSLTSLSTGRKNAPLEIPERDKNGEGQDWMWDSWEDNWSRVVRPLVLTDVEGHRAPWVN